MTTRNRKITEEDRAAAHRLRDLWALYKKHTPGATQETAAAKIGLTQSAFSQYLRGTIALNVEACIAFASLLRVTPQQIRDDLPTRFHITTHQLAVDKPHQPYKLTDDAVEIANAWSSLSRAKQQCFRDLIFLEAAVQKLYPWLRTGRPSNESYKSFERSVEHDLITKREHA